MTTCRKILVPMKLPTGARAGLAFARTLATELDVRQVLLLHVIDLNIAGEERGIPRSRLLNQRRREAQAELDSLAQVQGGDLEFEAVVEFGRPAHVIIETAREQCADAIVMCTHGLRGGWKWLHRNTAETVARSAPCPVWLISPGDSNGSLTLQVVANVLASASH